MKFIGNIIWIICGGLFGAISWFIVGLGLCATIIGIPIGIQCFKISKLSFWPFGKKVIFQGGIFSIIANLIWFPFLGIPLATVHLISAAILTITIVGFPFALQSLKLAKISIMPFGQQLV